MKVDAGQVPSGVRTSQSFRLEAIARLRRSPVRAFYRSPVSVHSNFQFHVISRIDIVHLLSVY